MDTSEIHYLTPDPQALWDAMHMAYLEAGGDVLYPGNEKEMMLRAVQSMILQTAASIDNALRMDTLRYAVRDYLDLYGEKRGCYRISATAAEADITITLRATGTASTIPKGTTVTQDGEVLYATTEEIAVEATDTQKTAHVQCTTTGKKGNALQSGAEMQLMSQLNCVESVHAATNATGGQNQETDDAYRERIRTYGLEGVTTGPTQRYEATALSVSSALIDAKAVNGGAGKVNVYLLAESGTTMSSLIADVEASLNAQENRPLTDDVHVYASTAVPYVLNVKYKYTGDVADMTAAIKEYKEWQENTIGQAYNPDVLISKLYQAGATRVTWGTGCSYNGTSETPTYHEISSGAHMSGTISMVVM